MIVLFLLLACYGLTYILMYGYPLNRVRNYLTNKFYICYKLFKCAYCTGFWSGLVIAILIGNFYILLPLASCAFCGIIEDILQNTVLNKVI